MSDPDPADPTWPVFPLSLDNLDRALPMSAADPELTDARLQAAVDGVLADNPHLLHELAAPGGTGDPVAARALSVGGLVSLAQRYGPTVLKIIRQLIDDGVLKVAGE